jgi:hypothetical protein
MQRQYRKKTTLRSKSSTIKGQLYAPDPDNHEKGMLDYIAYGGEYSGAFIFSSKNLNNSRVCRVCKRGVCRM